MVDAALVEVGEKFVVLDKFVFSARVRLQYIVVSINTSLK